MSQPSTPHLTVEQVRQIATLCRLGLTDKEAERMRDQLSHILEQFQVLQEVDTQDIPPTGHSVDVHSVMRQDSVGPSFSKETVLANAPLREEDYFRVRGVLE